MPKDALLEIGTEEIPALYLEPTRVELAQVAEKIFTEKRIKYKKIYTYATPRRLTLYIEGLAEKQDDLIQEIIGPAVNIAYDSAGRPLPPAIGFAQNYGLPVESLTRKKMEKGDYVCLRIREEGQANEKILPEIFIQIIVSLPFPKMMIWEETKVRFIRPIRHLLALHGNKVIKFSLAGVNSGKHTYGLFPILRKKIEIPTPTRYLPLLRNAYVLVDQKERKEVIKKLATQIAKKTGGEVYFDDLLLDEVTYLVEYPTAVLGKFSSQFLTLPREILITCLVKKQKFFPLLDKEGNLLPYFIGIRNGISEHLEIVQEGYQRVLEARLTDAKFFFDQDRKTSLENKVEKLKGVIFHEQIGTLYDKSKRIAEIANWLGNNLSTYPESIGAGQPINSQTVNRISLLSKADLVTEMVKEYPELQGVIGRIYALNDGEDEKVAYGIEQHYWPLTSEGNLPRITEAAIVSLADKLDTVVSDFALGLIPTGTADPYGLRRQASAILRILKEKNWSIPLAELIEQTWNLLPATLKTNLEKQSVINNLFEFFHSRLETLLTEEKIRYDEINAVLKVGYNDIPATFARTHALQKIRQLPDFEPLVISFKRAANILEQAKKTGIRVEELGVKEELFHEVAEKELWQIFSRLTEEVNILLEKKDYEETLKKIVFLRTPIDQFFDQVLVMTEDENLRNNRLGLLKNIVNLYLKIADFSSLVLE